MPLFFPVASVFLHLLFDVIAIPNTESETRFDDDTLHRLKGRIFIRKLSKLRRYSFYFEIGIEDIHIFDNSGYLASITSSIHPDRTADTAGH